MKTHQDKDFVSVEEAAEYLLVSRTQVYALMKRQQLRSFKPQGKRVYLRKSDLDAFIERGEVITGKKDGGERTTEGRTSPSDGSDIEGRTFLE